LLKQINIRNFAIFEDATIEPGESFNVITGESGAGKSIVVDALSLIRGARAYREMIRTGCDYAVVEAVFKPSEKKISELGIDDDVLVITRKINLERASECRINGKIRSLGEIIDVTGKLIDIHGQYENQNLADPSFHLEYLDAFAGKKLNELIEVYKSLSSEYNKIAKDIISLSGSESERERNREIYTYQINEIDSAGLQDISEKELYENWSLMKNNERFRNESMKVYGLLESDENSPYTAVSEAVKILRDLPDNSTLESIIGDLDEMSYKLLDISSKIRDFGDELAYDKHEFENLNDRIDSLKKLKRKYGSSIEAIMDFRNTIAYELETIKNYEKSNRQLLKKLEEKETELFELDTRMHEIRKTAARELQKRLMDELADMGMKDSEMRIKLGRKSGKNSIGFTDFGEKGNTSCEFLISLNKGIDPQPLERVASGGEMSRIMLAFKTIFTYMDDTETVVFDEIDSGLSGEASRTVAGKLQLLADKRQIIRITHLPQIAARQGQHFLIKKYSDNSKTTAVIEKAANDEDAIRHVAALTDGDDITEKGLEHARHLFQMYN